MSAHELPSLAHRRHCSVKVGEPLQVPVDATLSTCPGAVAPVNVGGELATGTAPVTVVEVMVDALVLPPEVVAVTVT